MIDRGATWIADAAGGQLLCGHGLESGPARVVADSREVEPGDLFVGIEGARADGGAFARDALAAGAWGVIAAPEHAEVLADRGGGGARSARSQAEAEGPVVISVADPVAALGSLARAWRRDLGCAVIAVTGSVGKTSTKDILAAMLRPKLRTHPNRENLNTEVGLPLSMLAAERGTEVLVLEMAMRASGQIAELVALAEPAVGVIVNVGPVHLESLGTVENVAAAKAELIRDLPAGAACAIPAGDPLLAKHVRDDIETITFGPGGDVRLVSFDGSHAQIDARGTRLTLELSYSEPHNLLNTLAAVAAAIAIGVEPDGRVDPRFSALRGEVVELARGVTVVLDCYNANPMSMRAALDHLAATPASRRIAVFGAMAELGPESERFHKEIGERASELAIDMLVAVGEQAAAYAERFGGETHFVETPDAARSLLEAVATPGDRVLVKGSRSAGLERMLATR